MSNKEEKVMGILLDPGFSREESTKSEAGNYLVSPSQEMPLKVDIFHLMPYDKNPRKAVNEKFEDIKESIRQVGLEHQFSITKRPDNDHYIIRSGGNTRLKALKELYEETKNDRFRYIDCRFVPFSDDLDLLSLHMLENELRGRMLFIDTAMAVKEFKELFEQDFGVSLSLRQLADEMNQRGWKIKNQHITYYLYSCEISEYLLEAFTNGLGRRIIEKVRQLENYILKWAKETNKDERRTLQYFRNVLKENDAPAINLSYIEESIIARLASEFSLNAKDVKASLYLIKTDGTLIPQEDEASAGYKVELKSHIGNNGATSQIVTTATDTGQPQARISEYEPSNTPLEHGPTYGSTSQGLSHLSMPQGFPEKPEHETDGLSPEAQKQLLNKTRHQLKDLFKQIFSTVNNFNEIFIENSEDTLFDILVYPKQMLDHRGNLMTEKVPPGDAAFYFAILMRLSVIHATVLFKADPEQSQKMMKEYLTASAWQLDVSQSMSNPSHVISVASSILPEHFQHRLIGFLSKEVNQGFNQLPLLDEKTEAYLRFFE